MANTGPNTNKSQFFITFRSCTYLDKKHTVFGRVVGGFDTLSAMEKVDTDTKTDKPKEDIQIESTLVFVDPYEEADAQVALEREKAQKEEEEKKMKEQPVLPKKEQTKEPKTYRKGVGKYINMTAAKRPADNDDSGASTSKKERVTRGFGDFSSW